MKEFTGQKELDKSILKQAIRDIASKNDLLIRDAVDFFTSEDFNDLCNRLGIQEDATLDSIKNLISYPVLPKKRLAEEMARLLNDF
jgi:hypothetical protein|tara:strand:- start:301 stop:558 length:258 start_codon:yes stop_codon:yes gene_type:complete